MHFCLGKICEYLDHRLDGFQKDKSKRKGEGNCKTAWTTGIGSGYVWCGEITDSRGEELTDKERIQLEGTEVSAKTEAGESEELQEKPLPFTTNCAVHSTFACLHTEICHSLCCQVTMLLPALSVLLACLLALLFYKDYKTRCRMKLAERIPGPKTLPLVGNLLDMGLNIDSKLHMFVCLPICHERHHVGVTMS
jgi:hypothetical protein